MLNSIPFFRNQFANITLLLGPKRRVVGRAHSGILSDNAVVCFR